MSKRLSLDEILKRDHSNKSYLAEIPAAWSVYYVYKVVLDDILKCDNLNEG